MSCYISGHRDKPDGGANCYATGDLHGTHHIVGPRVPLDTWHTVRIEMHPDTAVIITWVDGQQTGNIIPESPEIFKETQFSLLLSTWTDLDDELITGFIDDVRIGGLGQ